MTLSSCFKLFSFRCHSCLFDRSMHDHCLSLLKHSPIFNPWSNITYSVSLRGFKKWENYGKKKTRLWQDKERIVGVGGNLISISNTFHIFTSMNDTWSGPFKPATKHTPHPQTKKKWKLKFIHGSYICVSYIVSVSFCLFLPLQLLLSLQLSFDKTSSKCWIWFSQILMIIIGFRFSLEGLPFI